MMHGATVAAAAFIAFALLATDCAASGTPAGTEPAPASPFAERFDHAPLTAQRGDVPRVAQAQAQAQAQMQTQAQTQAQAQAQTQTQTQAQAQAGATPAAAARPVPPPVANLPTWDVRASDGTIRGVLSRWARTAGWQLVWDAPVDFSIDAQATLRGSFEDALQALVASLGRTSTPIQAILYQGNHVLRVVAQGAG
ncbi:toxin co-regulated pilus biosynthesis Q family protein [Burkholderia stagnalis]|uniref:toxin co-regulated pilus biosynthesis Q family protein n=1 Tax=Burkholderia stagnalis TaxID=1503054 RepID=UPI000F55F33B|nr:toxin co-regulated pilus biosynthesis Q family protein [Burkholderia stagnalis]RQQ35928.1 pili assembly chaperone [Burkholderia stagnalis]RQQ39587.1 pili assembly chaperone [Burkholderia stagnalis]RQQ54631.1 pili assembly chaperone [Burkholderia stagnalis]RQY04198.1 pili assembly chaperone [Burkholderia stagnalis]RQY17378.1 pili assembly chaperone [Burkholderia stagnalis]